MIYLYIYLAIALVMYNIYHYKDSDDWNYNIVQSFVLAFLWPIDVLSIIALLPSTIIKLLTNLKK